MVAMFRLSVSRIHWAVHYCVCLRASATICKKESILFEFSLIIILQVGRMRSLVLVSLSSLLGLSRSWDLNGHWIVSLIAGNMISDQATRYIKQTLPTDKAQDIPRSMAFASAWADFITHDPTNGYGWSVNLHFANSQYPTCAAFDTKINCPDGRCIVTAMANYTMRASDYNLPHDQRVEAVKFLIHMMGDIHQPMHLGFQRDDGGTKLWLNDPATTLHNVWDESLFEWHIDEHEKDNRHRIWNYYAVADDLLESLEALMSSGKNLKSFISSDDLSDEKKVLARIERIAHETSTKYTCSHAYKHVDGSWIIKNDDLDEDYFKSRADIMLQQFMRAGWRLANLLNVIAEKYFVGKQAACAAARVVEMNKRSAMAAASSGINTRNAFAQLAHLDCDSDNDDDKSVVGTLSEEEILTVEKEILLPNPSQSKKAKPNKISKKQAKKIKEMSDREFDAILKEFKEKNNVVLMDEPTDGMVAVAKKKKTKKNRASAQANEI